LANHNNNLLLSNTIAEKDLQVKKDLPATLRQQHLLPAGPADLSAGLNRAKDTDSKNKTKHIFI
jgi:hypothetical protein